MARERDIGIYTTPSDAWEIHRTHMMPNEIDVIIGQGHSCLADQMLLLYCSLANGLNGTVFMVDPQPYHFSDDRDLKKLRKQGILYGEGGALTHREEIRELARLGVGLTIPQWLGKQSRSSHIPVANASVHKIIDHHTTGFLACSAKADRTMPESHRSAALDIISDALREYRRALITGGKLMYQTNISLLSSMDIMTSERFSDLAHANGFTVEQYQVHDRTKVPVPHDLSEYFSARRSKGIGQLYYHIQHTPDGSFFIKNATYQSPDFFVCTKVR